MKKLSFLLCFVLVTSVACAQKSPRKSATGTIGDVTVTVDYGSPSVKGREGKIWGSKSKGDLENYGDVWRAGANENTTVAFDKDVAVGGKSLKAGKYGFFIIPKKEGDWVVIFNTKNDAWGAYSYKESEDALRLNVTPDFVADNQESLLYSVVENAITFAWEKARLTIPVKTN
ncbi:MAG: DUF2911 domain-containing protein [Flavobacteriaceae bacterium]|nr:DUF2911 domain-containing protein [Flavobacteriaceae bacterium]